MKRVSIAYCGGSGFFVSIDDMALLFDVSEHGSDPRILPDGDEVRAHSRIFAFASHRHEAHFSPTVYSLCGEDAVYLLGCDIPEPHAGVRMSPGETRTFGDVRVQAMGSSEEGVSFLVRAGGVTLFHAGDLNLWHWRDSSSIAQIQAAEKAFYDCIPPIAREKIDIAFFPVDPRQGSLYYAGASHFLMTVKPKMFIPMHFQGHADAARFFAREYGGASSAICVLPRAGERTTLLVPEAEPGTEDGKKKDALRGSGEKA